MIPADDFSSADPAQHTLIGRIAEMARTLRGTTGDDKVRTFAAVVATAASETVALVPGAEHAAVSIVALDRRSTNRDDMQYATDDVAAALTKAQLSRGSAPLTRAPHDVSVTAFDDHPNPDLADLARRHGVLSMMTMPLFVGARTVGVITAYSSSSAAFDAEAVATGAAVATHVALAALALSEDLSLRTALAGRDEIGQAKGILMERYRIDAAAAFDLLSRISQQDNRRLVLVASDVIATRATTPPADEADSAVAT